MNLRAFSRWLLLLQLPIGLVGGVPATGSDTVLAQSGGISGHVVDSIGQPVPGVSVSAAPETGGTATRVTTGTDGTYRFETLPDDVYRVDFELLGFDLYRRNHVRVGRNAAVVIDATIYASAVCECVQRHDSSALGERGGQVADQSGRPLPHARLEIVSPAGREVAYADGEGRFRVRVPANHSWRLTASDSGFSAVTQEVSGSASAPIEFKLALASMSGVPDTEQLTRGCRCPDDLFTHAGR
jgi:carboxypeptidase family protein